MTDFKEIKLGQKEDIIINGNEYYIEYRLTPERHKRLRLAMLKLEFGETYDITKIRSLLNVVWKDLNDSKVADGAVKLYNVIKQAEKVETQVDPALEACALFLLRKDEDVSKVDDNLIADKIKDFNSDAIARETFLALALGIQNGLKEK